MADSALFALVGPRIYAHRDNPPEGYKVSDGPCICMKVRGGSPPYPSGLDAPSVQFKCIGRSEVEALRVYDALYSALHEYQGGVVRWMLCEVYGQLVYEPQTGWVTVLTFFKAVLANE